MKKIFSVLFSLVFFSVLIYLLLVFLSMINEDWDKKIHETIPFPKVLLDVEEKIKGISSSSLKQSDNYITFYNTPKEYTACKVGEAFKDESLNPFTVGCGKRATRDVYTFRLVNVQIPEPGQCGFELTRDYLKKTLAKRYVNIDVIGERGTYEYVYLYHDGASMNREILKRGLGVYQEDGTLNSGLQAEYEEAKQQKKGLFRECNVTGDENMNGKAKFEYKK